MEPEESLPCSQERASSPYPETDESSPHLKIHPTITHPSMPGVSKWSLLFKFSNKNDV